MHRSSEATTDPVPPPSGERELLCPRCTEPIPGAPRELSSGLAECPSCGARLPLASIRWSRDPARPPSLTQMITDTSYRPDALSWSERRVAGTATFVVAPPRQEAAQLFIFALLWDCGGIVVGAARDAPVMLRLAYLLVAIVATWTALARVFSSWHLVIGPEAFSVHRRPFPRKPMKCSVHNIRSFDTACIDAGDSRGPGPSWAVRVLPREGRAELLPMSFGREHHARFVAERLTSALGALREPLGYRA